MTFKIRKSIVYAYPGSANAQKLGFGGSGCFYIELQHLDDNGFPLAPFMPHNAAGFSDPEAKVLIEGFLAADGDISWYFLKYGNPRALDAIKAKIAIKCEHLEKLNAELLEALEFIDAGRLTPKEFNKVMAAIAKARGE